MELIRLLVYVFYAYLVVGAVFAVFFLRYGASRLDADARGMSAATRALLFPGAAALWPVLARKWLNWRKLKKLEKLGN